jgi:hypothetical protein
VPFDYKELTSTHEEDARASSVVFNEERWNNEKVKSFVLSLSKHERFNSELRIFPFTPFDKLMTGFDRLRANGKILNLRRVKLGF